MHELEAHDSNFRVRGASEWQQGVGGVFSCFKLWRRLLRRWLRLPLTAGE
jgi:hypothetical protein